MNIEDIKKRNDRRKILMKERKNEYRLTREIEYNRLVEQSAEDSAYLLSIIEQAEKELNKIYSLANGLNANEVIIPQKAEEALQAIRGG